MPHRLTLVPELVPRPLWGISAARLLPEEAWRAIRQVELAAAGRRCAVCGAAPTGGRGLICHERWLRELDPDPAVAILAQLRIQCRRCDAATHVGFAESRGRLPMALEQLARVNDIEVEAAGLLVEGAFERFDHESQVRRWRVAVHPSLLARHPALADLEPLAAASLPR